MIIMGATQDFWLKRRDWHSNDQKEKIVRQQHAGWQWAEVLEACALGRLATCESDRDMVPDLAQ